MYLFLVIILIIALFWPWISRWLRGFMARRMEDVFRRMAGMPTRKEEQKRARQQARAAGKEDSGFHNPFSRKKEGVRSEEERRAGRAEAIRYMRLYAIDVEFIEIREYSATEIIADDGSGRRQRIYLESQVSDAEYILIK